MFPLFPEAGELLPENMHYDAHTVFKALTNQSTNRYLKELMKLAGIPLPNFVKAKE
jgi:hypothetical protein